MMRLLRHSRPFPSPAALVIAVCLSVTCAACDRGAPTTPDPVPPSGADPVLLTRYSLHAFAPEPSGLAYRAATGTLFTVSDSHGDVFEMDTTGRLLRRIPAALEDPEGIALSPGGDTIYVAEERNRRIVLLDQSGRRLGTFAADVATLPNNGLEGVTVLPGGDILALNEKAPGMIVRLAPDGTERSRIPLSLALDYSDISYVADGNTLWILSDESRKVMMTGLNGVLVREWALPFEKAEGIAFAGSTMYIVNDADATLYVFRAPR